MSCSHVESCELFVQFALNPALDVWKTYYCHGNFQECVRFVRSSSGQPIPLTLLPNGKALSTKPSRNDVGTMALFNSIVKHRTKMVSSLLRTGANIHDRNIEGKTALMAAAELGFDDIVALLLEHGARRSDTDAYGETAYDLAVHNNHASVAAMLSPDKAA